MTLKEKNEILTFITQELISPLFEDFRTGDEIWEKEHLNLFNKSQNFLENLLTNDSKYVIINCNQERGKR